MFDFGDAPAQQSELIPAKTLVKVYLTIKPGQHGDDGILTQSKNGFEYLAFEMTVLSDPYARRKIFQNVGVGGTTEGHAKAADISRSLIRGILESARGIKSTDESEMARKARRINSYKDMIDMEFAIEVGIDKGKDGYDDKNKISKAITPEHPSYQAVMNGESIVTGKASSGKPDFITPAPAPKPAGNPIPAWAQ